MQRSISDLIEIERGQELKADDILSQPEENIFKLRRRLKECCKRNENYLVCGLCYQPVYLAGTPRGEFFFKHRHERGDCPFKTKGKYSQAEINRMKYNGQKESLLHKDLKNFIFAQINEDKRYTDVSKEERIKSKGLSKDWRKPDVSSVFEGRQLVFEIQLSTTYLDVITERELFYFDEKIFILWIFHQFDIDRLRFTEKDIYHLNKGNAFVINDEATRLSEEAGELLFLCYYKFPISQNGSLSFTWQSKYVRINDLTFDEKTFKVYFFDFNRAELELKMQQNRHRLKEFEDYWKKRGTLLDSERRNQDSYYCRLFGEIGIQVNKFERPLTSLLNALFSVKRGEIIGYKFKSFVELANLIFEARKEYIRIFLWAFAIYGRKHLVVNAESFQRKLKKYKELRNNDPSYKQTSQFNTLLSSLFPELEKYLPNE